jgi:hypothetical protein
MLSINMEVEFPGPFRILVLQAYIRLDTFEIAVKLADQDGYSIVSTSTSYGGCERSRSLKLPIICDL